MIINIIDPITKAPLTVTAEPEDYLGEQGLRIIFPEKDSFVMVEKNREWQVMDETDINPELIKAIAESLKPHSRYNSLT